MFPEPTNSCNCYAGFIQAGFGKNHAQRRHAWNIKHSADPERAAASHSANSSHSASSAAEVKVQFQRTRDWRIRTDPADEGVAANWPARVPDGAVAAPVPAGSIRRSSLTTMESPGTGVNWPLAGAAEGRCLAALSQSTMGPRCG